LSKLIIGSCLKIIYDYVNIGTITELGFEL